MLRIVAFIGGVTIASACAAADVQQKQILTNEGADANLVVLIQVKQDCSPGPIPEFRIEAGPSNGWLVIKNGLIHLPESAPKCKGAEMPANAVYYRPKPGFTGKDSASIEITFADAAGRVENYSIVVVQKP